MGDNRERKRFRRFASFAIIFSMFVQMAVLPNTAEAASQKNPYNGKERGSYIRISTHDDSWDGKATYIYASKAAVKMFYGDEKVGSIEGAVYDKKTNTLTLTDFDQPTMEIETYGMGSSFKMKLVGTNSVQTIDVNAGYTDKYDIYTNSIAFTGKGNLTVNKNKKSWYGYGVRVKAEYSKSKITFAKTCSVTAYCNKAAEQTESGKVIYKGDKGYAICLELSALKKNAITSKGKLSKKVNVKKVNAESGQGYNYIIKGNSAYSKSQD